MKKSEKIMATIAIIFGSLVVAVLLQAGINASGGGGGAVIGMMFLGVIYGIRSIWKSNKGQDNSGNLPSKS
ncbi:hypothetical protein E4S40_12995 [Algoriphagus kandeliae]|uniref:Uncharacterized protein n=1 Tax=Algoriphagus kandeliae TaxID=2562278 RepID=A0A4Y9QQM1_9BACT|nr:hypothetical protein [Algoriphagus kandeliae]TFV93175.1 hypothetical protein E4S40_12995 [Algoriphagus kandeliae]